ncbi:hypothetical protein DENSPDRAFT_6602 [Dentipellis sp. KUC8613]|nr:hypothetical protein DENSPDRAFT_6602 [Dentipellis sp. KUC8613]
MGSAGDKRRADRWRKLPGSPSASTSSGLRTGDPSGEVRGDRPRARARPSPLRRLALPAPVPLEDCSITSASSRIGVKVSRPSVFIFRRERPLERPHPIELIANRGSCTSVRRISSPVHPSLPLPGHRLQRGRARFGSQMQGPRYRGSWSTAGSMGRRV